MHMITICNVCVYRFCTRGVPAVLRLSPVGCGRLLQGYVIDYSVLFPIPTLCGGWGGGHARHIILHGYNMHVHVQPMCTRFYMTCAQYT